MNLVISRLKDDLNSRNPVFMNLALQCIANIGSREMAENFADKIPKLLVSGYAHACSLPPLVIQLTPSNKMLPYVF